MKKFRFLSLLLCLLLALQCAVVPTYATQAGDTTGETGDTSGSAQVTDPVYDIPQGLDGDASVISGCNTIDGMQPLSSDPSVAKSAKGVVLYEMTTGTLVYGKNPDGKLYPASLTKVMTALVVLDNISDLEEMVTVSVSAVSDWDYEATLADLIAGEEMSVKNLLYCLMVESANDAGAVLAEHIAGSQTEFAELMNRKAKELGCTGTHFCNPHGLHEDEHYTTARDMAKITLAALEHDTFREIFGTSRYVVPSTNKAGERILNSTDYLIAPEIIDFYYDDRFLGGKTGYTSAAGRCLVSTAIQEGTDFQYLSVILGAQEIEDEDDPTVIVYYGHFEETDDVMDFGFDEFTTAEIYYPGQVVGQFPVAGGENSVVGEPAEACKVIVPLDYKPADLVFSTEVLNGGLTAPIAVGDKIGVLRVWYKNVCVAQTDILSLSMSKKDTMSTIFDGGVITDEESDKITGSFRTGVKIFVILVAVVLILSIAVAVYNAVIEHKRRKRRRNRRRSR